MNQLYSALAVPFGWLLSVFYDLTNNIPVPIEPEVFVKTWIFTHGIATLVSTNTTKISQKEIKEMIKKDITVLYVSHSKDIQEICERCIYLQKGKVIYDGTMQETLEKYPEFAK